MDGDVSISIAVTSIWACGVPDAMDGAWCTAPFQLRLHATDYQDDTWRTLGFGFGTPS
jgi:hypothetical protein